MRDAECLAHIRLLASDFLLQQLFRSLQRLNRRSIAIRLKETPSYGSKNTRLYHINRTLSQFAGLHVVALDDIRAALRVQSEPDLKLSINTASKQASSFMHAVAECKNLSDFQQRIHEAILTSVGTSNNHANITQRTNPCHIRNNNGLIPSTAGFGQPAPVERTAGESTTAEANALPDRDIILLLEILKSELTRIASVNQRLNRLLDRDFGPGWNVRKTTRYTGLTILLAQTGRSLCVYSRFLGGTGHLEEQVTHYATMSHSFIRNNVTLPVLAFYDKIFSLSTSETFDEESVSMARSSLKAMLIEFTERNLSHMPDAVQAAQLGSMSVVMDSIGEQVRHPFRNVFSGSLVQAMLLQIQKVKCDVDELMVKTKQILRAQELNLALVALVPGLLILTSLGYIASTASYLWRARDTHLIVSASQTLRFLMGDVHSCLLDIERNGMSDMGVNNNGDSENGDDDDDDDDDNELRNLQSSPVLRKLCALGALHAKLFSLKDIIDNDLVRMADEVKLRFQDDLKLLRNNFVSVDNRRNHAVRMMLCYPFLRD